MTDATNHAAMTRAELDRWYRDPGDLEVWEDIASWFHAETGHLRPGKDKAMGFHQCEDGESDCCHDAWLEWSREKTSAGVSGLLAERAAMDALTRELQDAKDLAQAATTGRDSYCKTAYLLADQRDELQDIIAAKSERIAKLEILLQEALDDQKTDDMPPFDPACCWQCRARIALAALAPKEAR